nr:hypothetical protein [Tanacetum cinerariifolium]
MDSFQELTLKSPSSWHQPLALSLNFYDHVNPVTRRTIDQSAVGKLRDLNPKESWAILEDLALYDNESWNDPRDFAKPVKATTLPQDVPSTSDRHLIDGPHYTQYCMENLKQAFIEYASSRTDELEAHAPIYNAILDKYVKSLKLGKNGSTLVQEETPAKIGDPGLFTLPCRLGDSEPLDTLANLGSCLNIILLNLFKNLNIGLLEEMDHIFRLADGTKSYPVRIVKDIVVHIGKLKLLNDFYILDMKKYPETPLLVGRGFLATTNVIIDCRMAKIAIEEGITSTDGTGAKPPYYARKDFIDCHLPREWEISRDAELNPFKDTLVFRRIIEFLGAIPINLKCNMWESENLIEKPIDWSKPPKNKDGA